MNMSGVSQMYNHIPGISKLTRKESLVGIVKYSHSYNSTIFLTLDSAYSDYYSQHPQCFNKSMFFPKSYRLNSDIVLNTFDI